MTEVAARYKARQYAKRPVTNNEAFEKGGLACVDTTTGFLTKGATSATLRPIGLFDETGTGDGVTKVRVRLFKEIWTYTFDNDPATPVVDADFNGLCYLLNDRTVTGDATGASAAGRVWGVGSDGVDVEMIGFSAAES